TTQIADLTPAVDQTEYDGIRNSILLSGGFTILARDSAMDSGTRRAYTGSIAGFPSATYWYDSSDRSWYDASTAGNRLIGF
ncbi:MAG: hypothetical protein MPJ22_08015, partial [Pirellulales bacterium]|nr:hypothetical protein [Pirellulales bacterium]